MGTIPDRRPIVANGSQKYFSASLAAKFFHGVFLERRFNTSRSMRVAKVCSVAWRLYPIPRRLILEDFLFFVLIYHRPHTSEKTGGINKVKKVP